MCPEISRKPKTFCLHLKATSILSSADAGGDECLHPRQFAGSAAFLANDTRVLLHLLVSAAQRYLK